MKFKIAHTSRGRGPYPGNPKVYDLRAGRSIGSLLTNVPPKYAKSLSMNARAVRSSRYHGSLDELPFLRRFSYTAPEVLTLTPSHSSRALNRMYEEKKLVGKVVSKVFAYPFPSHPTGPHLYLTAVHSLFGPRRSLSSPRKASGRTVGWDLYRNFHGPKRLFHRRFRHVSTGIGELLEEWTHKKSVDDLARCMSLQVDRVWLHTQDSEILVPLDQVQVGDTIAVRLGGLIPVDGVIQSGK